MTIRRVGHKSAKSAFIGTLDAATTRPQGDQIHDHAYNDGADNDHGRLPTSHFLGLSPM